MGEKLKWRKVHIEREKWWRKEKLILKGGESHRKMCASQLEIYGTHLGANVETEHGQASGRWKRVNKVVRNGIKPQICWS